jgi:hypothetical protein
MKDEFLAQCMEVVSTLKRVQAGSTQRLRAALIICEKSPNFSFRDFRLDFRYFLHMFIFVFLDKQPQDFH